jgi:ATP-binding protein involved in chromosome partitioning
MHPSITRRGAVAGAVALTAIAAQLAGRGRGLAGMQLGLTPSSKF